MQSLDKKKVSELLGILKKRNKRPGRNYWDYYLKGVSFHNYFCRLLFSAIKEDDVERIKELLKEEDIINYIYDNMSPLMLAGKNGRAHIVKLLLESGADIHQTNDDGETALMYAVKNNNIDAVELLLNKGAKVSRKDKFGRTACTIAMENNNEKLLKFLLAKNINQENFLSKFLSTTTAKGSRVAHSFLIHKISALTKNKSHISMTDSHNISTDTGHSVLQRTVSLGANLLSTLFPVPERSKWL